MSIFFRSALLSLAAAGSVLTAASPAHASAIRVVPPGHSIQAAVNRSAPGDTILLRAGAYAGGVVVTKSGLTIRGAGASTVLKPIGTNGCAAVAEASGICVVGTAQHTVSGVRIAQLSVVGFDGYGVLGLHTDGLQVTGVAARNNTEYGITEFASTRGAFVRNVVIGSREEAGIYVGDVADADGTVVAGNYLALNAVGLLVRHARGVRVVQNIVVHNCAGIALVDDGQAGGQGDTTVVGNLVNMNNESCPAHDEAPALHGTGIAIVGGQHDIVTFNVVFGNQGSLPLSGGIVLVPGIPPSASTPARPAADNVVRFNVAARNTPADLIDHSGSTTNTITHNACATSQPAGLC